jgi:serine/threonine protein kinase
MEPDRWEQIERLYHAALEREPETRESFLDKACADDEALRRELAGLLACDVPSDCFMQSPAIEIAARAMAVEPHVETSTNPMRSLTTGSQIGAYQLLEPLGRGGMGEVHLALDTRLGRKVAVKLARRLHDRRRSSAPLRAGSARGLGAQSPEHHHHSRDRRGPNEATLETRICGASDDKIQAARRRLTIRLGREL